MCAGLMMQPVAAFATESVEEGASASDVEYVSSVDITSNISEVLVLGKKLEKATLTTTNENVYFDFFYWYKLENGRWNWAPDVVTPGIYRGGVLMCVKDFHHNNVGFTDSPVITVDGVEWPNRHVYNTSGNRHSAIQIYSIEFEITDEEPVDPIEPIVGEGQWITKRGKTYYEFPGGIKATGMTEIDGDYYYFAEDGVLQRNLFHEENGNKYFFGSDGEMIGG